MNRIYFSLSILMGFLLITHSALAEQTRNVISLEQAISRASKTILGFMEVSLIRKRQNTEAMLRTRGLTLKCR